MNRLESMSSKLRAGRGKADSKGSQKGGSSSSGGGNRPEVQGSVGKNPLNDLKKGKLLPYKTEGPSGKDVCQFYQRSMCTRSNCRFARVCWRCTRSFASSFSSLPMHVWRRCFALTFGSLVIFKPASAACETWLAKIPVRSQARLCFTAA